MTSQPYLRSTKKLCVCARSKIFPICDNSHQEEGWSCALDESWSKFGFCASYAYQNLARKLAAHYQAALVLPGESKHVVDTLVTIVDGSDLEFPLAVQAQVQARHRMVVTLGAPGTLLQPLFTGSQLIELGRDVTVFEAFKQIRAYLDGDSQLNSTEALPALTLPKAFISHAVKDEALVLPAAEYLRNYFAADLFLCVDSISPGVNWQDTILTALQSKTIFVLLLSKSTLASHFCSFEIGFAYALNKPMRIFSLDGSLPPSFIQHIQVVDLPRLAQQKPWLDQADILLDELIHALASEE